MIRPVLGTLFLFGAVTGASIYFRPEIRLMRARILVDEAYRQYRPFAYRWAAAPHAPVASGYPSTSQLRDVLLAVQDQKSAAGIRLHARTVLLTGAADEAIRLYKLAIYHGSDAGLRGELGMAFAIRAEQQQRPSDYSLAIDHMMAARAAGDNTPASLHNLAFLFERFPMPLQALEHWRKLESSESTERWREEAKSRRNSLEDQLRRRDAIVHRSRLLIEFGAQDLAVPAMAELALEHIVDLWLQRPFTTAENRIAAALAEALVRRHRDKWLSSLLLEAPSRPLLTGLHAARQANRRGKYTDAEGHAQRTLDGLQRVKHPAAWAAAEAERVYSLQRRGKSCAQGAASVAAFAAAHAYTLLALHARLDEVACRTRTAEHDSLATRERLFEDVRQSAYESVTLRALGFLTERHVSAARPLHTWTRARDGLQRYWSSVAPPLRAHQFYYTLAQAAEASDRPFAAAALAAETELVLRQSGNATTQALAASKARWFAARAGLPVPAADTLLRLVSQPGFPEEIGSAIRVEQAETAILTGNAHAALEGLATVSGPLAFGPFLHLFREQARGAALLDSGDLTAAASCFRRVIEGNSQRLRDVHGRTQRDAAYREVGLSFRGLTEALLRQGKAATALAVWRAFRSTSPISSELGLSPSHTLEITMAYLPSGVWAWFRHGPNIEALPVGDKNQINRLAGRFTEIVSNPESTREDIRSSGAALTHSLSGPLSRLLPAGREIAVDAEGPLASVPWAAIPGQKGDWIDHAAVVQITAGREATASPRATPAPGELIVAEPALSSSLAEVYAPLDEARREAARLSGKLPHAALLHGSGATSRAITARIPHSRLFHFAGHGIANGGFGALLVAAGPAGETNHYLTARELSGLDLSRLDLVFLAACSAGDGETAGSLNVDSLVRAFLEARAAQVIAARWTARSTVTADLVDTFYDGWLAGASAPEALRRASLRIKSDPRTAHPFFWAGFQIVRRY